MANKQGPDHDWARTKPYGIHPLRCTRCGLRWYPDQLRPTKPCKPKETDRG